MAIVYRHMRADDGTIFYVGIGDKEKRAYAKENRNKIWKRIANKHGYFIEITHRDICRKEACVIEVYLIAFYGRIDKKTGVLANLTDGGDNGSLGFIKSDELKQKHRELMMGKKNMLGKHHSEETKIKISASNKNKKRSEETRKKIVRQISVGHTLNIKEKK